MNQICKDHPENRTWWGKCWQLYGLLKCSLILTYSLRQECCPHLLHCSFGENAQCGKIIRKSGIIMAVWPREPSWAHRATAGHIGPLRAHRATAGHAEPQGCGLTTFFLDRALKGPELRIILLAQKCSMYCEKAYNLTMRESRLPQPYCDFLWFTAAR